MALIIKAENDWRSVGRPQVAMHHNFHFVSYIRRDPVSVCVCVNVIDAVITRH